MEGNLQLLTVSNFLATLLRLPCIILIAISIVFLSQELTSMTGNIEFVNSNGLVVLNHLTSCTEYTNISDHRAKIDLDILINPYRFIIYIFLITNL